MSLREVLAVMPYRLRSRFESLSTYIASCIDQSVEELRRRTTMTVRRAVITEERRQSIQMTVFVVAMSRFFRDGTRAASLATDAFQAIDTQGFAIGNTIFQGRNDNVMMGDRLSRELLGMTQDDGIRRWSDSALPLGEIVDRLVREAISA
ncbi:hypothetical protein [Zavarzinella formosa]|uniref:hypothetical protein n=1 Tax=Zavarzinella formosa TaxID=360055 RepID=UPI0003822176|nr:hypothetical protein [Zavarzinella formosa]